MTGAHTDDEIQNQNPFPGPQPYRDADRGRFYGREELSCALVDSILASRCITVYGPSGAGKSSLVQASAVPALIEQHDVRFVRVDAWPDDKEPTRWLAVEMTRSLRLDEQPEDTSPSEIVLRAAQRAARRSPRLVIIYLDQIEQLLYSRRQAEATDSFFECINRLADMPLRNLRLVLSLREDYLGRFRDRLRAHRRLLDNGFRVGPLTVAELCDAVCKAAASGEPPQQWSPEQMRPLMLQVRVPGQTESDEAEAQAAYAQIVCRALFQERAAAGSKRAWELEADYNAEPILRRYFQTTLNELGPLRDLAQHLLEEHLITPDGSRTVRTEKELIRLLSSERVPQILAALEGAAILHAEEHQGSRYFELGHDWLARKVYEERLAREGREEQARREAAQREEMERQRAETEQRLAKERAEQRRLTIIAAISLGAACLTGALGLLALEQKRAAETQKAEAHEARILARARELDAIGDQVAMMKLLLEVPHPEKHRDWVTLAANALRTEPLRATLFGHTKSVTDASFSPDGEHVVTASNDKTARVWRADGQGRVVVLKGHDEAVLSAELSGDGQRVLTASKDKTARLWSADGSGESVVLRGHEGPVLRATFSPDGRRVLTVSGAGDETDGTARVWDADKALPIAKLGGQDDPIATAMFLPDGQRVITLSKKGRVLLWKTDKEGSQEELHSDVHNLVVSPDGQRVALCSKTEPKTARVLPLTKGRGAAREVKLEAHKEPIIDLAFSLDGSRVATASLDGTARIWTIDEKVPPIVLKLEGEDQFGFTSVAWSPDGKYLATASLNHTAHIWSSDTGKLLLVLQGNGPTRWVKWSRDGTKVLTAGSVRRPAVKVWSAESLGALLPRRLEDTLLSAFMTSNGESVLSVARDGTAQLWRADSPEQPVLVLKDEEKIVSAAITRDEKHIATASRLGTVSVWSADGREKVTLGRVGRDDALVTYMAFSPDGKRLVTASKDSTARVWSTGGAGEPIVLKGHTDAVTSAAWSPDGRQIVTTASLNDDTLRIWTPDDMSAMPKVLHGDAGLVVTAAFSPDGRQIVTGGTDTIVRVWTVGSEKPKTLIENPHTKSITSAVWSEDGKKIATSGLDRTIRVWTPDVPEADPIVLEVAWPVLALAFRDKGGIVAVTSNKTVEKWTLNTDELMERLRSVGCLLPEARKSYLGELKDVAEQKYEECERRYGRTPALEPQ